MTGWTVPAGADFVLLEGHVLELLPTIADGVAHAVVTSPPYLDARPEYPTLHGEEWLELMRELYRVTRRTMLLNVGRLWRDREESLWWLELRDAAKAAGWQHRDTRVWLKPNANPIRGETFTDAHELVLCFAKPRAEFNTDAVRLEYRPGSVERLRRRHVNHVGVKLDGNGNREHDRGDRHEPNELGARPLSYMVGHVGSRKGIEHPAPMPLDVAGELVVLASWPGDTVLDPFAGSGTTLVASRLHARKSIGIELVHEHVLEASRALAQGSLLA